MCACEADDIWHISAMTATIDSAGRVVIPKSLRDRAGLAPGTEVDFRFHDGMIEIAPVVRQVAWERVGRVRYPVLPEAGLTTGEIQDLLESGRADRLDDLGDAGR